MRRSFAPAVFSLLCIAGCGSLGSGDKASEGNGGGAADPGGAPKTDAPAPTGTPGGAAPAAQAGGGAKEAPTSEELKQKAEDAAVQVELAKTRLERATMDADQQRLDGAAAVEKAKFELATATKARDHFVNVEMPIKGARSQLDLQQAKDYLSEQEEELQQLELMYKKDDLADKTKEIVLARTKRRLERARQGLALQQKDLDDLLNVQQPDQLHKLEVGVADRTADLRRAEFGLRSGQIDKDMAVKTQQVEVNRLAREADKAKKALDAAAPASNKSNKT
jgi:flagellar hook-basal body complex protein FliE